MAIDLCIFYDCNVSILGKVLFSKAWNSGVIQTDNGSCLEKAVRCIDGKAYEGNRVN